MGHSCWGHIVVAPFWVSFQANLGTLLRTCDAIGACTAVPSNPRYRALHIALSRGQGPSSAGPRALSLDLVHCPRARALWAVTLAPCIGPAPLPASC